MHLLVNVEFDQSTKLMFCLNLELQVAFAAKQFMHDFFGYFCEYFPFLITGVTPSLSQFSQLSRKR